MNNPHVKRILIVEDHYMFQKKAINAVAYDTAGEDTGVLVTCTADPIIAEALLLQNWDVILMDHDLPMGYSGWQLLNNTSVFGKRADGALVIAISAVPENNKRLMAHGAHFRVEKMDCDFERAIQDIINNN